MREGAKTDFARGLRKNESLAEKRLWEQLRNRKLDGFKFVRQFPVGPYVADFVCREKKLVVELDGWTHSTPEALAQDARRSAFLNSQGYRVVRFSNESATDGMDGLLTLLQEELHK